MRLGNQFPSLIVDRIQLGIRLYFYVNIINSLLSSVQRSYKRIGTYVSTITGAIKYNERQLKES